ncbi:MAG TPA: DUF222 domain-containing protein [Mycobacteriales bacterium]|nr:DUF222 domain-containing protein [Mycobacteriales bacterium]
MARTIGEILGELKALLAVDPLSLSQEQAITDAQTCLELEAVTHALTTQALKTVDDLNATVDLCGRTTKSWLREDVRMSKPEAGRRMKFLRFLGNFPIVTAAYHAGELSTEHISALLSALMSLPPAAWEAVEGPLVEQARFGGPDDVKDMVDDILTALGVTKKSDIQRERRNGALGFRLTKTMDGFYSASGLIDPATGELVRAALDAHNGKTGPDDLRSPMRRDHDALATIARRSLEAADQPGFGGSPVGVLVTIPYDVLEGRVREQWLRLPSGMRVAPETARRLACDAEIVPVVLGSKSEVLDIGRSSRQFTSAQRRGAYVEQGGRCAFPKCRRRCVELHHIEWWSLGGRTSIDNGAWLCAFHHWLVHEGGWTMRRGPDRSFVWTNQIGHQQIRHLSAA